MLNEAAATLWSPCGLGQSHCEEEGSEGMHFRWWKAQAQSERRGRVARGGLHQASGAAAGRWGELRGDGESQWEPEGSRSWGPRPEGEGGEQIKAVRTPGGGASKSIHSEPWTLYKH